MVWLKRNVRLKRNIRPKKAVKNDETFLKGSNLKWTKEAVFEESKKYHTINEFRKNCNTAYVVARKNKWLKDMHWLEKVLKWTKEAVFEESKKHSNRSEFFNGNSVAYRVALKNKWLDEMVWLKNNK